MNLKSGFKRVACGGILLSCAFLSHGSGVAAEANATRALSARQRNLAFNQSQSDEDATVAPSQVDDGDDDDDERNFALFESVSKASTNAMKGIKSNAMVQKVFSKETKLAKTEKSFDKFKLQLNDPDKFFLQPDYFKWHQKTIKRYEPDEIEAYAAMYSTVLSRSDGDEKAVAELIGNPWNFNARHWFDAQNKHWKARNLDTEKVYDLLRLRYEGTELLNSPKLSSWVKFAEANNENPAERLWELLRTQRGPTGIVIDVKISSSYDAYLSSKLGGLLKTPRKTPDAERFGSLLATKLLQRWKQQKYPIEKALQDLRLGKDELIVWKAYIRTMDKKDPYTIFVTAGKFEDEAIVEAFGLALQSKDRVLKMNGQKMQRRQNEMWSKGSKTPEGLFDDLKLQDAGDNLFSSRLWPVWISYLKYEDEKYATNLMMDTLKKYFGNQELLDIATKAKEVPETKSIASIVEAHLSRQYRYLVSVQDMP